MPRNAVFEFFDSNCSVHDPLLVGNKAHHLMAMTQMGLPVPEGFALPTYLTFDGGLTLSGDHDLRYRVGGAIRRAADRTDREWGSKCDKPYLVSVRSGAPVSMPGMMDTICNVGLNDNNFGALAKEHGELFAADCYRRLLHSFGTSVLGIDPPLFNEVYQAAEEFYLTVDYEALLNVVACYQNIIAATGNEFPQDVDEQLFRCVEAVYLSWYSDRAEEYRKIEHIDVDVGTAVVVQGMKFGNLNEKSGTGVLFSKNPNTGADEWYGDFALQAQGEDVVSGEFKTVSIPDINLDVFPGFVTQMKEYVKILEDHHGDMVDIEFTIEDGTLWILQSRKGEKTHEAQLSSMLDKVMAGEMDREAFLEHVVGVASKAPVSLPKLSSYSDDVPVDPKPPTCLGHGLGAVKGTVIAPVVFTINDLELVPPGEPYIFVASSTSPNDIGMMKPAAGILTATGGLTSHATIKARAWHIPAIVGCGNMAVGGGKAIFYHDDKDWTGSYHSGETTIKAGDIITIDGKTGSVYVNV